MITAEDPRDRFRELPDPPRPEELVETSDVTDPTPLEPELEAAWRKVLSAGG